MRNVDRIPFMHSVQNQACGHHKKRLRHTVQSFCGHMLYNKYLNVLQALVRASSAV